MGENDHLPLTNEGNGPSCLASYSEGAIIGEGGRFEVNPGDWVYLQSKEPIKSDYVLTQMWNLILFHTEAAALLTQPQPIHLSQEREIVI